MNDKKLWIDMKEVSQITGIGIDTLKHWAAARRFHHRCARKQGHLWKFKKKIIEEFGIVFNDEPFPKQY